MWLFDLFKSKEQSFEDKVTKMFQDAARDAMRKSGGNEMIAGVMTFYAISTVYKELNENYLSHMAPGLSRAEYMTIVERAMNNVGRKCLSNWDQLMHRRQPDDVPDLYDY